MNEVKTLDTARDKVEAFQNAAMSHSELHVELKLNHIFSDGIYARELFIPKGTIVVGKIHKFHNLNFMTKGKMEVLIGDEMKIIEAPFHVVSPPNTKRIARALEDTVWVTVLRTDETNIDKIDDAFTCDTTEEFLAFCKSQEQFKLPLEH